MPSTLPNPMPLEVLRKYRWATPITAATIPTVDLSTAPAAADGYTDVYIGKTTSPHVFADSPAGSGLLPIRQTVWGYGMAADQIHHPGPTLVAKAYVANQVRWINTLPEGVHHPFAQPPTDARLGGMMGRYSVGHACVHLHGAHVCWTSDGHPVRRKGSQSVLRPHSGAKPFAVPCEYPNTQMGGAMLWYHDHTMDMTSMNVYSGLAGGYLLRDPGEAAVTDLPSGDFEMPLIIQDRSFTETPDIHENWMLYGHAPYLRERIKAAIGAGTTEERRSAVREMDPPMGEFKGDAMCVNGKIWPHLVVQPRVYRFRILNGCNTRMLVLRMSKELRQLPVDALDGEPNVGEATPQISMVQIGGDDGFISPFVPLSGALVDGQPSTATFLVLASGERADVLIDFSQQAGTNVYLSNHATENSPLGNGGDRAGNPDENPLTNLQYLVLQFRVTCAPQPALDDTALTALNGRLTDALAPGLLAAGVPLMPEFNLAFPPVAAGPLPLLTRRYVIREQLDIPLKATDHATLTATGRNPPGRFGWNAITMQPDPSLVAAGGATELGLMWAGPAPDSYGGPPAGGPYIDAQNQPGSMERHILGGPVELWEFYNLSGDVHPLHLHLASFQVLSRQNILVAWAPGEPAQPWQLAETVQPDGSWVPELLPPDANEKGWKDTVRVNAPPKSEPPVPGEPVGVVTRLLVRFDNGGDARRDYSGHFVFHCHLLEHEDMGMMRPLEIYQPRLAALTPSTFEILRRLT